MSVNPYDPPDESSEREPDTNDPPANGCAVAFAIFGMGSVAALILCFPMLRSALHFNRPNSDLTDGLALLLFGVCWIGAATFARRMNHVTSLALAILGIGLFFGIGTFGRMP